LAQFEGDYPGGHFPPPIAGAVAVCLEIAEGYARGHEQAAARGWDPLELLRGCLPWALSVARGDTWKGHKPPWEG
jgi:hypothetical protein